MHELSIATELFDVCEREVAGQGGGLLKSVRVAVGDLSSIEPDLLRFAWEAVVHDTPHAGCRLDVDWRPAEQTCDRCGAIDDPQPGSWLRLCPTCGEPLRLVGGHDLDLLTLTLLQDEPAERTPAPEVTR